MIEETKENFSGKKDTIISFICKPNEFPRKINKEKLNEKKFTNKTQLPKLMKEGKIELNNETLYLKDFYEEKLPITIVFIIFCPNVFVMNQIVNNTIFDEYKIKNIKKGIIFS